MRQRWLAVGLLALGIFVINVIARVVTKQFEIVDAANQIKIALIGMVAMGVLLIGAGAWWAVRYPFSRLFFDIGAAVLVGALLSLILYVTLIPTFSWKGALVGSLISETALAVACWVALHLCQRQANSSMQLDVQAADPQGASAGIRIDEWRWRETR